MASPPSYNSEFVPVQGNRYVELVDPCGDGMTPVQHTIVRMPPPRDHIIWSICSLVYVNPFCLGLLALYFSVKSRDRKLAGDMMSAREYGSTARCLNIVALIPIALAFIGIIAFITIYYDRIGRIGRR